MQVYYALEEEIADEKMNQELIEVKNNRLAEVKFLSKAVVANLSFR